MSAAVADVHVAARNGQRIMRGSRVQVYPEHSECARLGKAHMKLKLCYEPASLVSFESNLEFKSCAGQELQPRARQFA